jgi:hypothetical protein
VTAQDAVAAARDHYEHGERALGNCRQHSGELGLANATFHAVLAVAHFTAGMLALALRDEEP